MKKMSLVFGWLLFMLTLMVGAAEPTLKIERSFSSENYEKGTALDVLVTVSQYDNFEMSNCTIHEYVPVGWTIDESSFKRLNNNSGKYVSLVKEEMKIEENHIEIVYNAGWHSNYNPDTEETTYNYNTPYTFKYTVTAPADAKGDYSWNGNLVAWALDSDFGDSGKKFDIEGVSIIGDGIAQAKYNVFYYKNDGTEAVYADNEIEAGDYSVLDNSTIGFSYDNHDFVSWNTQADGKGTGYTAGDVLTITDADVSLYAPWELVPPTTYTVVFHGNGGKTADDKEEVSVDGVEAGEYVLADGNVTFSKENSDFLGWALSEESSDYVTSIQVPEHTDVYAQWQQKENPPAKTIEVTYHINHAYSHIYPELDLDVVVKDIQSGTNYSLLAYDTAFPEAIGFDYAFAYANPLSWNTKSDGSGTFFQPGDEIVAGEDNLDFYIQWEELAELAPYPLDEEEKNFIYVCNGEFELKDKYTKDEDLVVLFIVANYGLIETGEFRILVKITNADDGTVYNIDFPNPSIQPARALFQENGTDWQTLVAQSLSSLELPVGKYVATYELDPVLPNEAEGSVHVKEQSKENNTLAYFQNSGYEFSIVKAETEPKKYNVIYHSNLSSYEFEERELEVVDAEQVSVQRDGDEEWGPILGYRFVKWNTSADGLGADYYVGDEIEQDLELYGVWEYLPQLCFWFLNVDEPTSVDEPFMSINASNDSLEPAVLLNADENVYAHFKLYNFGFKDIDQSFVYGVKVYNQAGEAIVDVEVPFNEGLARFNYSIRNLNLGAYEPGTYTLELILDSQNNIEESKETDDFKYLYQNPETMETSEYLIYRKLSMEFTVTKKENDDGFTITYNSNFAAYEMPDWEEQIISNEQTSIQNDASSFIGYGAFGLHFVKWNTQSDALGDDYYVGDQVNGNLELFAIWELEPQLWFWPLHPEEGFKEPPIYLTLTHSDNSNEMAEELLPKQKIYSNFNVINWGSGDADKDFVIRVNVYDEDDNVVFTRDMTIYDGLAGKTVIHSEAFCIGEFESGKYTIECIADADNTIAESDENDIHIMYEQDEETMENYEVPLYKRITLDFEVKSEEAVEGWPEDKALYSPTDNSIFVLINNLKIDFSWPQLAWANNYRLDVKDSEGNIVDVDPVVGAYVDRYKKTLEKALELAG